MTDQAPKRKKRPRDANQLAKSIVDIATGEKEDREPTPGRRNPLKGDGAERHIVKARTAKKSTQASQKKP